MQTLIEDLLSYSKASISDRLFTRIDLNKIVSEVSNDLSESIAETGTIIEAIELCEVDINLFQFRQVLNNLITNSIKFSKTGIAPHITIRSKIGEGQQLQMGNRDLPSGKLLAGKEYCHIIFSDNGIGFETEYQNKIFEVFQRLHSKQEYAGTGIGLAIVKKIIENHSGTITASGGLNKGARFDIYIPAVK